MKKDFESRFMPSCKFSIMGKNRDLLLSIGIPIMCNYVRTSFNGDIVALCDCKTNFEKWEDSKEVSIYEAIPELIPDGMRYNKELDKLVPDVIEDAIIKMSTQCGTNIKQALSIEEWSKQNICSNFVGSIQLKLERVNNGGNHIAFNSSSFDTLEDALKYNKENLADEYNAGIDLKNHRAYNVGSSNYSSMNIQPWDIWKDWKLDPWDADIIKRISRTKEIPGKTFEEARIEDYEKIKHICDEKILQLKEVKKC